MRCFALTLSLALAACTLRLSVDENSHVTCQGDAECPGGTRCELALGECVLPGFTPAARPVLSLAFSSPRNGETDVARRPQLIIAFDHDVDEQSVIAAVTLRGTDGQAVPISNESTGLANTYILKPDVELAGEADYVLSIAETVRPLALLVDASPAPWNIAFRTTVARDSQPPSAVSSVVVDMGATVRTLTFTNPLEDDFAGVLIVRATGADAAATPVNGVIYPGGATIGNSRVAGTTRDGVFADLVDAQVEADYLLFAFDNNANYSPAVHPPRLREHMVRWCPNELLYASSNSPDAGVAAVEVLEVSGAAYSESGVSTDLQTALGGTVVVPAQLTPAGATRYVRNLVLGESGVVRGPEQAVALNSSEVRIAPSLLRLGVGGAVTATVSLTGWSGFEAGIDGDPSPSAEGNWVTLPSGNPLAHSFFAQPAGGYRFRARPVEPGCPQEGNFTVSALIEVGSVLYVRPGGNDSNSGADPSLAKATISAAVSAASGGTEIRIAGGQYTDLIAIDAKALTLTGGFTVDFSSNNPATEVTYVLWHGGPQPTDVQPTLSVSNAEVHVSGMTLDYDEGELNDAHATVEANALARLYLDGVKVLAPRVTPETHAVRALGSTYLQVRDSTFRLRDGVSPVSFVRTVRFEGEDMLVENSHFESASTCTEHFGIQVERGRAVIDNNTFSLQGCTSRTAIACGPAMSGLVACRSIGNDVTLGAGVSATSFGITYANVLDDIGFRSTVFANRIFGMTSGVQSRGIAAVGPSVDLEISDNIVHSGDAQDSVALTLGGGMNAMVTHNIFIAGGAGGSRSSAVLLASAAPSSFANNVLATSGSNTNRHCLEEGDVAAEPMTFVSNALLACPTALYLNEVVSPLTDLAMVNALGSSTLDWPIGCSGSCQSSRVSGNVGASGVLSLSQLFSDPDGPDNDVSTVGDNDYLFATMDPVLRAGGIDPLTPSCGTVQAPRSCVIAPVSAACGTRGCDYFGVARTCTGPGQCVSFGPFEQH